MHNKIISNTFATEKEMKENKLYQGVISFCCYKPVEMLGVSKGFCCSGCKKEIYSWMDENLILPQKQIKNRK